MRYIVQDHLAWRQKLCDPKTEVILKDRDFTGWRRTIGVYDDGLPFDYVDNWMTKAKADKELRKPWRGKTILEVERDEELNGQFVVDLLDVNTELVSHRPGLRPSAEGNVLVYFGEPGTTSSKVLASQKGQSTLTESA